MTLIGWPNLKRRIADTSAVSEDCQQKNRCEEEGVDATTTKTKDFPFHKTWRSSILPAIVENHKTAVRKIPHERERRTLEYSNEASHHLVPCQSRLNLSLAHSHVRDCDAERRQEILTGWGGFRASLLWTPKQTAASVLG